MDMDGYVRLYRMQPVGGGNAAPVAAWIAETEAYRAMIAASGRWFTDSLEEALWYEAEHPGGEIVFVDLPWEAAESFRVSSIAAREGRGTRDMAESPAAFSARPEREFFVSREVANLARALPAEDMTLDAAPAF